MVDSFLVLIYPSVPHKSSLSDCLLLCVSHSVGIFCSVYFGTNGLLYLDKLGKFKRAERRKDQEIFKNCPIKKYPKNVDKCEERNKKQKHFKRYFG